MLLSDPLTSDINLTIILLYVMVTVNLLHIILNFEVKLLLSDPLTVFVSPSVVVILCGGNIDTTVLGRCLERGLAADGRLARFTVRLKDRPGSVATLTKFLHENNARLDQGFSHN